MAKRLGLIANHLGIKNDPEQSKKWGIKIPTIKESFDFFYFDKLLPKETNARRKELRAIFEAKFSPIVSSWTEKSEFPKSLIAAISELKLIGWSEENSTSKIEKSLIIYELARVDVSIAIFYVASFSLVVHTIEKLGSEEQRLKYLPALCSGNSVGCWGLTEPEISKEVTATLTADGYILNGTKRWLGNALLADIIIIFAKNITNNQVEGFIVDSKSSGLSIMSGHKKLPLKMLKSGNIILKNVFVHEKEKLVKTHKFATNTKLGLEYSVRILTSQISYLTTGFYQRSAKYIKERVPLPAYLASVQLSKEKFVGFTGMAWKLIQLLMKGQMTVTQGLLVKLIAKEASRLGKGFMEGNNAYTILMCFWLEDLSLDFN
ncbi:unnamed protein product [Blepharisma stoltei]|uniref:Acyl-CoA dehydrogenase n=1 Tax=Blepharisma stoltei TaxID=1481888 RepID=A0AAU9KBT6_9CILI|nr:unnamed protein product [Blepharisma stoltei]